MDTIPSTPPDSNFAPQNRFADASMFWSRLHRYQLLIKKHWWVMPFCVCLVLFPVGYWALKSPPFFETRARMWMAGKLNLAEGKLYNEELTTFLGTQAELLRSATIRSRAIDELKTLNQTQNRKWNILSNNVFESSLKLDVRENLKTAIIDLRATGPESEITQAYLNQIMQQYMEFRKEVREKTSDTTLAKITEQVKSLQTELNEKQAKLHAFQTSNNVVFLQEQGSSASSFLGKIERQRADMVTELNLLNIVTPEQLTEIATRPASYNFSQTAGNSGSGSAQEFLSAMTTPQAEYNKTAQQIQLLEAKKERLSKYLKPIHPKITKLDEDIAAQKQLVEVFKKQSVEKLQQRRDSLKLQLQNLDVAAKEWEKKTLETSAKMSEYTMIQQEVQRAQSLYDKLVSLIQSVDVNKKIDQETVRIMENASTPLMVRGTVKKMLLGLIAGIILGVVSLYLIELFDDRFTSISELRNQLTEIVIGQIPEMTAAQLDRGRIFGERA